MMNGESLVSHLQSLGVPGAQHLTGCDYDWLLMAQDSAPLLAFLHWLVENVSPQDVLCDAELTEYEDLVNQGKALTMQQLEDLDACVLSLPASLSTQQQQQGQDDLSQEEQDRLHQQLEVLSMRKNQLSTHKMEVREEAAQLSQQVERMEVELRRRQQAALATSHYLSQAQHQVAGHLHHLYNVFENFDQHDEGEAVFLSQLDLQTWHQEEEKFTDVLRLYTRKQFNQGVREVVGAADNSEYCLLDTDQLDLHLVRGAGQTEYQQNVRELNRLTDLLRETEEWQLEGELVQACRRAEVEAAHKWLSAMHQRQLPATLPLLQQQLQEVRATVEVVSGERRRQHQVMRAVVGQVAQLESTRTISGNYQLKCKRQQYFLDKQKIVMEELWSQAARHNWVSVALDTERRQVQAVLGVLAHINSLMTRHHLHHQHRMNWYQEVSSQHQEGKAVGQLVPPLSTLSHLLPGSLTQQQQQGEGTQLRQQVDHLLTTLSAARHHTSTAVHPQFSSLSKMTGNCGVLEKLLFGDEGRLSSLPLSWLTPQLALRYSCAEDNLWKFKQKMMKFITELEEKKKVLQVEPAAKDNLMQWTQQVTAALV